MLMVCPPHIDIGIERKNIALTIKYNFIRRWQQETSLRLLFYLTSLQTFHFSSTNSWLSVTDIMPMYIVYGWIQYEKKITKNHQSYVQGKEIHFTKKNFHTNIIVRTT